MVIKVNDDGSDYPYISDFRILEFDYFAIILKNFGVIGVGEDVEDARFITSMHICINSPNPEVISELEENVTKAQFVTNLKCEAYREATTGFFLVPCTEALAEVFLHSSGWFFGFVEDDAGICLPHEKRFSSS